MDNNPKYYTWHYITKTLAVWIIVFALFTVQS